VGSCFRAFKEQTWVVVLAGLVQILSLNLLLSCMGGYLENLGWGL